MVSTFPYLGAWPSRVCPQCHRGRHWANECHSQTDVEGCTLQEWGNSWVGFAPTPSNDRGDLCLPNSHHTIEDLCQATPRSLELDLSPSAQYVLTPEMCVQAIPMGIYGPLPKDTVGLILGRSSMTLQGL
jgi:hypothetical protein